MSEAAAEPKSKPKPKRVKKPKLQLSKIASSWSIFRASVQEYRTDWKPYVKILAVVAVPSSLLALVNFGTADQFTGSYASFFSVVMNVALIWAIVQRHKTGKVPGIAAAYYDGSIALVRFILVSFALVFMLVPAFLGASLYAVGMQATQAIGSSYGPEQLIVLFVSLLVASPSFYLLVRYALAPLGVVRDGLRPMVALRRARIYTLGRFWPVAGRYVLMILFLLLTVAPILIITFVLSLFKLSVVADFWLSTMATLVVLPIGNLFVLRLYRELEDSFDAATAPTS